MKKKILILFLAILLISSIGLAKEAEDKPPELFNALRVNLIGMNYADYTSSMACIALDRSVYERNLLMQKPLLAVSLLTVGSVIQYWGLGKLWEGNKTIAWIMAGALTIGKAYIFYKNLQTLMR